MRIEKRKQKQRPKKKKKKREKHQRVFAQLNACSSATPLCEYKIGRHFRANPSCISPMAAIDHSHLGGRVRYDVLNNDNWRTSSTSVVLGCSKNFFSILAISALSKFRASRSSFEEYADFRSAFRPLRSSASALSCAVLWWPFVTILYIECSKA